MLETYRSDGKVSTAGAVNMLISIGVTGMALGWLAHTISQFFYLIFVFPAAIGAGVGFAGKWMIRRYKVRAAALCFVAGAVAGIFAMVTMHYLDFRDFAAEMSASPDYAALQEVAGMSLDALKLQSVPGESWTQEELDGVRAVVTAVESFPAYMNLAARDGVQIGSATSAQDDGINLGYVGSWIYWVIEAIFVAGIASTMMSGSARVPFCGDADAWMIDEVIGGMAGEKKAIADAVAAGELARLSPYLAGEAEGKHVVQLRLWRSPAASAAVLEPELVTVNRKGEQTTSSLGRYRVTPAYAAELVTAVNEAEVAREEGTGSSDTSPMPALDQEVPTKQS